MTLSLDTNVLMEVLRNRNPAVRRAFALAITMPEPLVTSLIVYHELLFGAVRHHDSAAERIRIRRVINQISIEPLDVRDVAVAAEVRGDLAARGLTIGPFDLLIAGQALARHWTVVTNNTSEFGRVDGLKVIDWAEA